MEILTIYLTESELKQKALMHIELILNRNAKSLHDYPSMPYPHEMSALINENRLIFEELNYDIDKLNTEFELLHGSLNVDQKNIYDAIMDSCRQSTSSLFFVYGGGGTGKTLLWKTLIARLRSLS